MGQLTHVIGFDDGAFPRERPSIGEAVLVMGVVCSGTEMHGALRCDITRDGDDATERLAAAVEGSRFKGHVQALMFQGLTLGGFNVLDLHGLHRRTGLPVLVLTRRAPDLPRIKDVLHRHLKGGAEKWALIEAAGEMVPLGPLYAQWAGMDAETAATLLARTTREGNLPEPLRLAHIIASAVSTGESTPRP